ncbi:hypothetical protein [Nostoc sp.]|uniref:hypothetical protein n=1 Tax=Nostoc sp. TaxID=1180 RepID=UPI002FFC38F4
MGIGYWALGIGHGAWGMGHGAWGMGHGAWGIVTIPCKLIAFFWETFAISQRHNGKRL